MSDRQDWTAPMWQARLSRESSQERAIFIIKTMVPEEYRARVTNHVDTVMALRNRDKN